MRKEVAMKRLVMVLIVLLTGLPILAQSSRASADPPRALHEVQRNIALEKSAFARTYRLGSLLQPAAKAKLDQVIRELLVRLASKSENVDPYDFVQQEVHRKFVQLTIEQSNLLSFYVLAEVTRIITVPDELKGKLDIESMGGLSEEISMRLQMMLDKRSKVIRPISNIMKEISSTQDTLVQNIK